jgi:hypothetical protein
METGKLSRCILVINRLHYILKQLNQNLRISKNFRIKKAIGIILIKKKIQKRKNNKQKKEVRALVNIRSQISLK